VEGAGVGTGRSKECEGGGRGEQCRGGGEEARDLTGRVKGGVRGGLEKTLCLWSSRVECYGGRQGRARRGLLAIGGNTRARTGK